MEREAAKNEDLSRPSTIFVPANQTKKLLWSRRQWISHAVILGDDFSIAKGISVGRVCVHVSCVLLLVSVHIYLHSLFTCGAIVEMSTS